MTDGVDTDGSQPSGPGLAPADEQPAEIPVVVAVHIRPLIEDELYSGCRECLAVTPGEPQVCCGHHTFNFDQVYGGGGLNPAKLYSDCVDPLVQGIFSGYNATVFAYGQTGSGKTFTMGSQFTPNDMPKGIIPDVLQSMFGRINAQPDVIFTLRVGFVEIHKEEIHDLLLLPGQPQPLISIREMPNGSMCIAGATEIDIDLAAGSVASKQHVFDLLMQGTMARATSMTLMNARSSRSHAVFSLALEQRRPSVQDANDGSSEPDAEREGGGSSRDEKADGEADMSYLCAKMLLVDLAGSERVKRTGATGARLQEGIHINQGLLSLANVIQALVDGHRHVPYRNSKLTRLLQDSLGHNSRTVMIACVSPADSNMEETINTLRYANRARNIKNKPVVNRDPSAAQILLLRQQLAAARAEISVLRSQLVGDGRAQSQLPSSAPPGTGEQVATLRRQLGEAQGRVARLLAERDALLSGSSGPDGSGANGSSSGISAGVVDRMTSLQARVLELEAALEQSGLDASARGKGAAQTAKRRVVGKAISSHVIPLHKLAEDAETGELSPGKPAAAAAPLSPDRGEPVAVMTEAEEREHQRHLLEEERLRQEVRRKEEQLRTLTVGPQAIETKQRQDQLITQLTKARREHAKLQKDLEVAGASSNSQKVKHDKAVKRQRKELEDMGHKIKKIEVEQHKMEMHMGKKDALVSRLKNDINRKASELATKQQQIATLQQRYETLKKGNARQISDLRRDNKRVEHENQRLKLVNEKRQQVIHRKMKEAEEAKKRLAVIERRQRMRRPAAPSRAGSAAHVTSALHTAPAAPLAHAHFVAPPSAAPVATFDDARFAGSSGPLPVAVWQGRDDGERVLRPNADAPVLADARAMELWIREELDAASTAHDTRVVLEGTLAKRGDIKQAADKVKAELARVEGLAEAERAEAEPWRRQLTEQLERMQEEMEACSKSIATLHSEITAAVQQNGEARADHGAARFALVREPSQAQALLATLFQVACDAHGELLATRAENAEADDATELLRLQLAEAEEKAAKEAANTKALADELAALRGVGGAGGGGGCSPRGSWSRASVSHASAASDVVNMESPQASPARDSPAPAGAVGAIAAGRSVVSESPPPPERHVRSFGVPASPRDAPGVQRDVAPASPRELTPRPQLSSAVAAHFTPQRPAHASPAALREPSLSPAVMGAPAVVEVTAAAASEGRGLEPQLTQLDATYQELLNEMKELSKSRSTLAERERLATIPDDEDSSASELRTDGQESGRASRLEGGPAKTGGGGSSSGADGDEDEDDEDEDDGFDDFDVSTRLSAGLPPAGGGAQSDAPSVHLPMPPHMFMRRTSSTDAVDIGPDAPAAAGCAEGRGEQQQQQRQQRQEEAAGGRAVASTAAQAEPGRCASEAAEALQRPGSSLLHGWDDVRGSAESTLSSTEQQPLRPAASLPALRAAAPAAEAASVAAGTQAGREAQHAASGAFTLPPLGRPPSPRPPLAYPTLVPPPRGAREELAEVSNDPFLSARAAGGKPRVVRSFGKGPAPHDAGGERRSRTPPSPDGAPCPTRTVARAASGGAARAGQWRMLDPRRVPECIAMAPSEVKRSATERHVRARSGAALPRQREWPP